MVSIVIDLTSVVTGHFEMMFPIGFRSVGIEIDVVGFKVHLGHVHVTAVYSDVIISAAHGIPGIGSSAQSGILCLPSHCDDFATQCLEFFLDARRQPLEVIIAS